MDEIGGLIVDLIKSAAQSKVAQRKGGQPAQPASQVLRRILVGPGPAAHATPPPLLADFSNPRRFLAAFVLAEALGPPVGLKGHGPG